MIRKVRVKGPGVKLKNKWCYIGDEAIIDEQEYEKNKEYIDVIEEIEAETEIEDAEKATGENQNPEGEQEDLNSDDDSNTNVGSNEEKEPEEDNEEEPEENEDEELEALKERAKELGINVTHNMKKETIIKKIEDAEKATGENQNPEGE